MRGIWMKRAWIVLIAGTAIAAITWFAWPRPIPVDIATVSARAMEVTIDDEAKTRVRHIYTVSAPIAGRVLRISPPRHIGDDVTADETIVAAMQPPTPNFLDTRSRSELDAAVAASEAGVKLAEAEVRRLEAALEFARSELKRAQALSRTDTISARALEKARLDVDINEAALASAKAQVEVRRHDLHNAKARLIEPSDANLQSNAKCCIELRAPVSGRVLKINQESEAVVQAGAPLIEIGNPVDLEVVAELLSSDAVQIKPGSPVRIDGWGGAPIRARVTRVDPAGFLKVSALGIEEQRVRTTIDFVDPPAGWARLGHDYRVIVHITVWSTEKAVATPVSALFRKGDDWAVFRIQSGRAQTTTVNIGRRNSQLVEILSGLAAGDRVVLHPSDKVRDGLAVVERQIR